MKRTIFFVFTLCLLAARAKAQQTPEVKFIADTLVVQADGTYETDPDVATMVFDVSSQDKDLQKAYGNVTASMQRIITLANTNGLKKSEVSAGTLTHAPSYDRDGRGKPKSYYVQGEITLRVHDFSKIGPLLDGAVQDNIVDYRSLTYSLQDEEAAKERAAAEAMRNAVARANAGLAETGQKLGPVRYASLDVRQLIGVATLETIPSVSQSVEVHESFLGRAKVAAPPPPMPPVQPSKISVTATVQCAFAIK